MSFINKLIYSLNIIAVIALLFSYISPYVDPNTTWFFSFFGLGYPILLFVNIGFVLFWLVTKIKYVPLSLIVILLGYNSITRTIGFNKPHSVDDGFSVMSYNIGGTSHHFSAKDKKTKIAEFKKLIKELSPDVVCLQERQEFLIPILDDIFKAYTTHLDPEMKTCIYSKLPISDHGKITFDTPYHSATWADVGYNNQRYRIYGLHLSSNKVPNLADNFNEIIDESVYVLDKYSIHAAKRVQQLDVIMKHAKTSPHPVLITGDFNDMPQSYTYRKISKEYCDAFIEQGNGLGKTQKSNVPGLRIDYAFVDENIDILDHDIIKSDLSDHSPIITTIK
jgi:endonuclease/exonuclease/phosphatase family metal-dependent hydrolase